MLRWRGSNSTVREVVPNKEGAVQHQVPPSHRASRKWPRQAGIGALALVLVVYVVVPLLFYASPWLRRQTVFLTFVNLPPFPRLNKPESYGLGCPHNFYLDSDIGIRLGAWHLPPQSAVASHPCDQLSPDWFGHDDRPIVLYLHGNGGSRAGGHRLHLYQVITQVLDAHVVALDYRGYGDSSPVTPTAEGIVSDAQAAYRWLRAAAPNKKILVWGHSLGTGVSVYLLHRLSRGDGLLPDGVVLEAPFDALHKVAQYHPLSLLHRWLPYFQAVFVDTLRKDPATNLDSMARVREGLSEHTPIMVLHAKDDGMVPFPLGQALYRSLQDSRERLPGAAPVSFVQFEASRGHGHKHIHRDDRLPKAVQEFFKHVFAPVKALH